MYYIEKGERELTYIDKNKGKTFNDVWNEESNQNLEFYGEYSTEDEAREVFDNLQLSVVEDCGSANKYIRFEIARLSKADNNKSYDNYEELEFKISTMEAQ